MEKDDWMLTLNKAADEKRFVIFIYNYALMK